MAQTNSETIYRPEYNSISSSELSTLIEYIKIQRERNEYANRVIFDTMDMNILFTSDGMVIYHNTMNTHKTFMMAYPYNVTSKNNKIKIVDCTGFGIEFVLPSHVDVGEYVSVLEGSE